MSRKIIVSDLHIDYWNPTRRFGPRALTRKEYFLEFLDAVEQADDPKVDEFIINGDLMDLPPYNEENFVAFPSDNPLVKEVVERIFRLGATIPITYIFGNHDIGVSGFRCKRGESISVLNSAAFWYPRYVAQDEEGKPLVLLEHGHLHDPALEKYAVDLDRHLFSEDFLNQYGWAMQRRKAKNPSVRDKPGALPPVSVTPQDVNAHRAALAQHLGRETVDESDLARLRIIVEREYRRQTPRRGSLYWFSVHIREYVRQRLSTSSKEWGKKQFLWLLFWGRALASMRKHLDAFGEKPLPETFYLIFGHTHRTVPELKIPIYSVNCIYMNSGTWTEDSNIGTYLDINKDGKVWLQDWINDRDENNYLRKKKTDRSRQA